LDKLEDMPGMIWFALQNWYQAHCVSGILIELAVRFAVMVAKLWIVPATRHFWRVPDRAIFSLLIWRLGGF
jgi:hypothetical protein